MCFRYMHIQLFITARRELTKLLIRVIHYRLPLGEKLKGTGASEVMALKLDYCQSLFEKTKLRLLPSRVAQPTQSTHQGLGIGYHDG